jgi:hypothetical protein
MRLAVTALLSISVWLIPARCAPDGNYSFKLLGPRNIYAGYDLYVLLKPKIPAGSIEHIYLTKITAPPGVKYSLTCGYNVGCWTNEKGTFIYRGGENLMIQFTASPKATPGNYTATLVSSAAGTEQTTTIPLNILPAPEPVHPAALTAAPPIPGIKFWEKTMQTLGHRWCDTMPQPLAFGAETQVWYYDGARVYFQIADYTHDKKWEACAFKIAQQYRDYALGANGNVPGWRNFAKGLRMAFERSGDAAYKQAVLAMAQKSAYAGLGGSVSDEFIRETAYLVDTYVEAEKLGAPRNPMMLRSANFLLGHVEMLFQDGNYFMDQTFFDGLASEALIEYYGITHDPRVPGAIKVLLDGLWKKSWNSQIHKLAYNPDPPGPSCDTNCQKYFTDLINLVAPAYAWYWRLTGDPVYQKRGDEMFDHALDGEIDYSGKIFSQNYRWSFDYVKWRSVSPEQK